MRHPLTGIVFDITPMFVIITIYREGLVPEVLVVTPDKVPALLKRLASDMEVVHAED